MTAAHTPVPTPQQNHLLAALPAAEFLRLSPHLELVAMPLGEALYESGGQLQHVYFPTTSIVSLLYVLEDGASAEIAVVGNGDYGLVKKAFDRLLRDIPHAEPHSTGR
jgi:CRP-like cAMP-binding protein